MGARPKLTWPEEGFTGVAGSFSSPNMFSSPAWFAAVVLSGVGGTLPYLPDDLESADNWLFIFDIVELDMCRSMSSSKSLNDLEILLLLHLVGCSCLEFLPKDLPGPPGCVCRCYEFPSPAAMMTILVAIGLGSKETPRARA